MDGVGGSRGEGRIGGGEEQQERMSRFRDGLGATHRDRQRTTTSLTTALKNYQWLPITSQINRTKSSCDQSTTGLSQLLSLFPPYTVGPRYPK